MKYSVNFIFKTMSYVSVKSPILVNWVFLIIYEVPRLLFEQFSIVLFNYHKHDPIFHNSLLHIVEPKLVHKK